MYEGFLLHLRNLLAFFTSQKDKPTDLGINAPVEWVGRKVDQRNYSDLMKVAREINEKYGQERSTCSDQISKFLQHCTAYRHERSRGWNIEAIFADLDPMLREFERRFVDAVASEPQVTTVYSISAQSTAALRTGFTILIARHSESLGKQVRLADHGNTPYSNFAPGIGQLSTIARMLT
jgi:hypothetical protein